MNKINSIINKISLGCCGALLMLLLNACVGVVGPGPDGPYIDTYVPGPDVVVFGGYGGDHHYDHVAAHRGAISRGGGGFHGGGGRR